MQKLTSPLQYGHRDGSATPRQLEVLRFLRDFQRDNGYSASILDVATMFGLSVNGTNCHLKPLERKGLLTRKPKIARTFVVTKLGHEALAHAAGGAE